MVDFKKLMTPEHAERFEEFQRNMRENRISDIHALLAESIHFYHNASGPRASNGNLMLADERSYSAVLHHVLVPELLRRIYVMTRDGAATIGVPEYGVSLPNKCPMCGVTVDWNRVDTVGINNSTMTKEQSELLNRLEAEGEVRLEKWWEWRASKVLVGRGLACRSRFNANVLLPQGTEQ